MKTPLGDRTWLGYHTNVIHPSAKSFLKRQDNLCMIPCTLCFGAHFVSTHGRFKPFECRQHCVSHQLCGGKQHVLVSQYFKERTRMAVRCSFDLLARSLARHSLRG